MQLFPIEMQTTQKKVMKIYSHGKNYLMYVHIADLSNAYFLHCIIKMEITRM